MNSSRGSSETMADGDGQSQASQVRSILAAAGASGTWDWDIEQGILHFDERFAELYDLTPEQAGSGLPSEIFFKAIHPADRARMRIAVAGMLGGAELFSKEFRVVDRDGLVLWMHGRGQCHLDPADNPVRFTGLLVDVTERKRTEERLRVAQSAGGIGTFEYVDGFATASVSSEFCRLLGLHPATALPVRTINRVVDDGGPPLIPQPGDGTVPETLDGIFRITRNDDGERRWIARRGEILREGQGYRLIGVVYDVTSTQEQEARLRELNDTLELRVEQEVAERREAEEALRQAQKMEAVGQLTGGIAHDFNNLLTIIIGNIDTVLRRLDADADPRHKRSLGNALKGAERAVSLTQRLLAFSRRQPLDPKILEIGKLLAGMSDLLTRSISESIAIEIDTEADLWPVEADPHQLENVILNLAVNARDAMPNGGRLTITARNVAQRQDHTKQQASNGDFVEISVADTGIGMSTETVGKVFDPFFTTKEVGKGTGLGLSMVYGFTKQSGGHVSIESSIGRGTTVRLLLGRSFEVDQTKPAPLECGVGLRSGSETIMVVEDDDEVRAYTVGILQELGYRVVEAQDGARALELLNVEGNSVDLLFSDVVMPGMSGRDLAEHARDKWPGIKVLFTSGYTRDVIMSNGRLEAGADLISKPFTFSTLAQRVREIIDRPIP
jgi:PAS domain S-box-containing protein